MVLADLGRKITTALRSLSNATVINEEVSTPPPLPTHTHGLVIVSAFKPGVGAAGHAEGDLHGLTGSRRECEACRQAQV